MLRPDLVPAAQTGVKEAQEIVFACLDAGIPAILGPRALPKLVVLVPSADMGRAQAILRQRWLALVAQAGERQAALVELGLSAPPADAPCPACGSTDPLADGACSDYDLQLA